MRFTDIFSIKWVGLQTQRLDYYSECNLTSTMINLRFCALSSFITFKCESENAVFLYMLLRSYEFNRKNNNLAQQQKNPHVILTVQYMDFLALIQWHHCMELGRLLMNCGWELDLQTHIAVSILCTQHSSGLNDRRYCAACEMKQYKPILCMWNWMFEIETIIFWCLVTSNCRKTSQMSHWRRHKN